MKQIDPLLRIALYAFALALVLALLAVAVGYADSIPPSIKVNAPLHNVFCRWPVCCGTTSASAYGRWYETGITGYCKWWRLAGTWPTLREEQTVMTKLYLVR